MCIMLLMMVKKMTHLEYQTYSIFSIQMLLMNLRELCLIRLSMHAVAVRGLSRKKFVTEAKNVDSNVWITY